METQAPGAAPETFAGRYESVLVPVIFRPWAHELIRRAGPRDGEDILDLGCGTGVVTRTVAASGIVPGSMTGVDFSAGMLAEARVRAASEGLDVRWVEADAGALPLPDDSFDVAFCQQAFQFFPDRPAALRELRRVLRPGGRVAICVQTALDENPQLRAQAETLERHVGPDAGAAVRAICGLPDGAVLRDLFVAAGFCEVSVERLSLSLFHPDGRAFAAGAMGGMHTGDKLSDSSAARRAQAVQDFLTGLGTCYDGTAIRFPHVSNVVTARA